MGFPFFEEEQPACGNLSFFSGGVTAVHLSALSLRTRLSTLSSTDVLGAVDDLRLTSSLSHLFISIVLIERLMLIFVMLGWIGIEACVGWIVVVGA